MALRVYESSGRPALAVSINFRAKVQSAHEANLMEDSGISLSAPGDTLRLDLGPFEIKTIRLRLGDGKP